MAEEEVVTAGSSPVSSDHKRKFEDLEPEAPQPIEPSSEPHLESNANSNSEANDGEKADVAVSDEGDNKRPRIDDELDGQGNENGYEEHAGQLVKEKDERSSLEDVSSQDGQHTSEELPEATTGDQTSSPKLSDVKELSLEDPGKEDAEDSLKDTQPSVDATEQDVSYAEKNMEDSNNKQDASSGLKQPTSAAEMSSRKIEVPNNKVGVLIGKAGDTIRYLQYNSGAKIQITRDADSDPHSATRAVELIGSSDSIDKAEKLINAVIAEAEAGGSPSLVARGLSPAQAAAGAEQIQIQVPNEKVGLIIGRGGETIKGLQTRSGARIQLIPQHLPEGDDSKERTVQVTGDRRQIEVARELIKEVMSQPVRPSSGGFSQQTYRPPRGSAGPPHWSQRGSQYGHPSSYDYQHRGPYPPHNPQYAAPSYGGYPQHMPPRGGFGSGWDQRSHPSMQGPPPNSGGYGYYGGQGHLPDAPTSTQHHSSAPPHAAGPSPVPSMGPPQAQVNYNYGQPQGPEYVHQPPYPQAGHPQQGYGHGYDESKFDNRAPSQHPYGGHASSQPNYAQSGAQPGYVSQQQYGKPPLYGMPSQGQPLQSYGPPRAAQSGDMPYQNATAQTYGANMPSQQPYPYASSGPSQPYPAYGSATAPDGYNQPPPADSYNHPAPSAAPVYAQPTSQPSYSQPAAQQAPTYGQVAQAGGYGSYPSSQQGYSEQPASNNAAYGYQAPQEPGYGGAPAPAYSAAPTAQAGYVQPVPTQSGYDQSNPQSGYGAVQANAPAAYGKTLSPQPAYPQYDSTQVYGAPR